MSKVKGQNWVLVTEMDKVAHRWWHFHGLLSQYRLLWILPMPGSCSYPRYYDHIGLFQTGF
jgi:hypothetical protein